MDDDKITQMSFIKNEEKNFYTAIHFYAPVW